MKFLLLLLVPVVTIYACQKKLERNILPKADLRRALIRNNVTKEDIDHYMCIAEQSSGLKATKIVTDPKTYITSYGLFQVNDTDACSEGKRPGGICNIRCKELATFYGFDKQVKCAIKIVEEKCFWGWNVWLTKCRHTVKEEYHILR